MKEQIQNYLARPKRYDNIDGTGEMTLGVMMLSFALVSYLSALLPEGTLWRKNGLATFEFIPVVMLPIWAFQFFGVKAIKKHLTWPRTGYVAYRRNVRFWCATVVTSAALSAGLVLLIVLARRSHSMSFARAGYLALLLAAYAFFILRSSKEHLWKWLVVVFMALGLLLIALLVPGDISESFGPVALFLGLVWLGSGIATLGSYLRHTRIAIPEHE